MLTPGALLQGRYLIVRRIGGGGMAVVYLAQDTRLQGRRCAIKEMSPAQLAPKDRRWATDAFRQEAHMLAQLRHPGLTPVTDFFSEGGNWYLVMNYVEGETLHARLERARGGRLPLEETLDITRQLCDVLEYLHTQSPPVVFRDLKPSNVMLTPDGQVKLIDFGIARFFKGGQTQDTVLLGTPGYAAPEQYGGLGQSDARADIYSLGVLLLQMVTGYDPTTAPTPFSLPSADDLRQDLPSHVKGAISRAARPQPDLRHRSVREFRQALVPQAPTPSPPSPVPTPGRRGLNFGLVGVLGVAGVLAVVALGVGIIVATHPNRATETPELPSTPPPTVEPTATLAPSTATPAPASDTAAPPTETPVPPTRTLSPAEREQRLLRNANYRRENGEAVVAHRVDTSPQIDGRLGDWDSRRYDVAYRVHDPEDQWDGRSDLYGRFGIVWDEEYLYLGVDITDDIHVQQASGEALYKGDDVEIQIDSDLAGDFQDSSLSGDDGQVGLSAGDLEARRPEAYIWRPPEREGPGPMIPVAARRTANGYTLEAAIPWWTLGDRPALETPVGFCLSLTDNDLPDTSAQQTMISSAPTREWGDPTTWGTLILVDWR